MRGCELDIKTLICTMFIHLNTPVNLVAAGWKEAIYQCRFCFLFVYELVNKSIIGNSE